VNMAKNAVLDFLKEDPEVSKPMNFPIRNHLSKSFNSKSFWAKAS